MIDDSGLIGERLPFRHGNDNPRPARKPEVEVGSGNVFADLGLPDAEKRLADALEDRARYGMASGDHRDELLRECARHLKATEALFATLPDIYRTSHLALRSRDLAERIRRACPTPDTETPNG